MKKNLTAVPIDSGTPVHINTSDIPAYVAENIAQVAFRGILRAYNDPVIQEDYRRWKAERDAKRRC